VKIVDSGDRPSGLKTGGPIRNIMKKFHEQTYPVTILVNLVDQDGENWLDEIKGLNVGHALYRAKINWPALDAEFVKITKDKRIGKVNSDNPYF